MLLKNALVLGILFSVFVVSGCVEQQSSDYSAGQRYENRAPSYDSENTPSVQNINGVNKVMDVSGKIIRINGQYNEITILNKDVSEIWVNGQYNTVYYPRGASPLIKDNGVGDEIKTY